MKELFSFLDKSVSPYHSVWQVAQYLDKAGFNYLEETEKWQLLPGGRYYVTRNQSSIIAF